jgi:hypothetical protein
MSEGIIIAIIGGATAIIVAIIRVASKRKSNEQADNSHHNFTQNGNGNTGIQINNK